MDFGAIIQSILYIISSSLFYPALVALLLAFIAIVIAIGSFLAEWSHRRKQPGSFIDLTAILSGQKKDNAFRDVVDRLNDLLSPSTAHSWADVEIFWETFQSKKRKDLEYLRIISRLAPSVGLIGTLIPMSTGLAALSQGDMSRLSSDMVVAFTCTVVGLAVGVVSFALFSVRAGWVEGDLSVVRVIVENLATAKLGDPK